MPETPLSLIQYFKDQHILKGLGNKQKKHLKHIVGRTLGVEFPPVTGCLSLFVFQNIAEVTFLSMTLMSSPLYAWIYMHGFICMDLLWLYS